MTLKAAGLTEHGPRWTKAGEAKFRAWSNRKDEIGYSQRNWPQQKQLLQAAFRTAFKNSARKPGEIARFWNSTGFKTFSSRKWHSAIVLTAANLAGVVGFVRTAKPKSLSKNRRRPQTI